MLRKNFLASAFKSASAQCLGPGALHDVIFFNSWT